MPKREMTGIDDENDYTINDWGDGDELEEGVHSLSVSLDLARDEGDLTRIAQIGLTALADEDWFAMHDFTDYALSCQEIWDNALAIYEGIIVARQQG